MSTEIIHLASGNATYLISDQVLIKNEQDALDLMGEVTTQAAILHDYNFEKDFFDLSTQKLGTILQKFTNYRFRIAVIGDFTKYPSQVLVDFMRESNRRKEYIFVRSLAEVKNLWG